MATIKQRRLARKIPEALLAAIPPTGGELLADAGYGLNKQKKPGTILNSKGVQEELAILGFTEEKAKEVVGEILGDTQEKAEARLKAADMVFKSFGTYAPEKHANLNVTVSGVEPDLVMQLADKAAELLKIQKV